MDLLLDPAPPPNCDNWRRIKLNDVVTSMHSNTLQELIHKDGQTSLISTFTELFENLEMREYISFKIRNPLPAILPKQLYNTDRGMAVVVFH